MMKNGYYESYLNWHQAFGKKSSIFIWKRIRHQAVLSGLLTKASRSNVTKLTNW